MTDFRPQVAAAFVLLNLFSSFAFCAIDEKVLGEALALRERGEFEKATQSLQVYLDQTSTTLEADERRRVEFEVERIRRIRMDYKLTREKLMEQLKRRIPDITEEEFNTFEREGKFDVQVIDGQKLYVNASVSNLLIRVPELKKRQKNRKPDTAYRKLYANMQRIREAQKLSRQNLLVPQDFAVTYTLIVNKNAAPEGKPVRCWMPFINALPFQTDSYIIATEPAEHVVAPPEFPHRTIYLERLAKKDEPTTFKVQYIYRAFGRVFDVNAQNVLPYDKESWQYKHYTADRKPHLDLQNEELKRLSNEIVSGETNPYNIARKIYDWITNNVIYQYAREYSTLENLSYYCASRKAGDCGQHAMLYIALCRLNGIPARWQSGWESFESSGNNMHDWCEIYFEPFGWVPVDVDMAINFSHKVGEELDTTQTRELVDFMFCNMDHYRLVTNTEYGAPLYPAKQDFRSETVDFQRGEVESDGKNLYFDQWSWEMDIQPISTDEAQAIAKRFLPAEVPLLPLPTPPVETTVTAVVVATPPVPAPTSLPTPVPAPPPAEPAATTDTVEAATVPTTATVEVATLATTSTVEAPATPAVPTPAALTPETTAVATLTTAIEANATQTTTTP